MSDQKQTKFEEDLQAYFPDIYKIHTISKWDKYVWDVWRAMMEMIDANAYGEITIKYHRGHINKITKSEETLGDKQFRPYLNHPGVVEE